MSLAADLGVVADLPAWQAMLDRHGDVLSGLVAGAAVGLVPRAVADAPADAPAGAMLVWGRTEGGMAARAGRFGGFAEAGVDLLFVAEPGALVELHQALGAVPFGRMKEQIREGRLLLYVMRTKTDLLDAGYEDFLESLGLAFLGACR